MKTKNLLKILILFILAGTIANAEYFKENGEVYYKMPYFEIKSKVKGADAKTLENVGEDNMEMAGFFGKDSTNAYFIGKKIKDVSPKGFEILDAKYVKDDKNLYKFETDSLSYFSSNEIKTKKVSIDGLDVKSFKVLENNKDSYFDYYVDKSNVYIDKDNLEKITGADRNSFEILGYSIARDKNNVYNKGEKLGNIDIASFKYFDNWIAKDKNRVFYMDERKDIKNVDAKTFERMGESYYFRDKNNVFALKNDYSDSNYNWVLEMSKNIDRSSFDILNTEFGKDKNGVYYFGEKIDGISSNNAKVVEELGDYDYIFQSGNDHYLVTVNEGNSYDKSDDNTKEKFKIKKINGLNIDYDTFKYFEMYDLYKDKNNFYYHSDNDLKKIKSGIDVKSAEKIIELRDFIKDKNNIYYFSDGKLEKVNLKIDVNNLEYLDDGNSVFSSYLRDGKNVYFVNDEDGKIKIVKNVDKNTFKVVNGNYGVDSKNVYYLGEKLAFVGLDGLKIFNEGYLKDKKNVYEISVNDNDEVKVKPIKNLNIDVATFEDIFGGLSYKDKNAVYYAEDNDGDVSLKILQGADPATFEFGIISKDKNSIFIGNQKLEGVSSKGFEILDDMFNFVKDYKNVYYLDRESDGINEITYKVKVLDTKGVDIPSLEFFGDSYNKYFKDKDNIYFLNDKDNKMEFEKLAGANPKTFEIVDDYFARDDKNLYIFEYKVDGIDPKTFEALNYEMIKDKNGVYFLENISEENENSEIKTKKLNLKGLDLRSFKKVNDSDYYFKDKNSIYYEDSGNLHKIENADLKTFKDLDYNFAKDKNNIYYKNKKLDGIDAASFEKIVFNFIKDKNRLYKIDEDEEKNEIKLIPINEKVNLENFEEIGGNYYKDDKNLYYFEENEFKKIDGSDPNSFEYDNENYTFIAKDKNNVYFDGEKVKGIDVKSAEGIDGLWIKDKNSVFYRGKKLEKISSNNFNYFDGGMSYDIILVDKNGAYKLLENENQKDKIIPLDSKNIDLKTLERIESPMDSSNYFKDKNGVYFLNGEKFVKINGADIDTFEVTMSGKYGKDKNNVYFEGKKMEGENPKKFEEEMEIK
ncbi:DKNYY domain-containing protein [Leptotrichia sp. oral taxon 221]|uniref:DKNYY domain-containing protein n=1 Tax=Leptotrichia sp. oral taxon 221 TaxID=712362 RepID=UPI001B8D3476|nr:DKNYY domain-containing protein [Leptotrichia sp. oral taxon 221]QUB97779.1 DKNYY domain-containing protein [Leptotrichia sp. oral taxon 221]